ncbi:MAG: trans-sulfuration enzyme family protein [Bacillota bacterium]
MKRSPKGIATTAVHAGTKVPESVTMPKVPPIYAASVFSFDTLSQLDEVWEGRSQGYVYSRMRNPGIDLLEETVNSLEGGAGAVAFASGMAAITVSALSVLTAGDHVVSAKVLYGGTYTFFHDELPRRGVSTIFVDVNNLEEVRAAMQPNTRMLYCETVSNPLMEVADLGALAFIAHESGAILAVDNTFASPVLCRPLAHGADLSIHSSTKYLNGHSDVTGGIAVGKDPALVAKIRSLASTYGPVPSPFDAWLVMRGIRTIDLRVRKCSENALALAGFLARNPTVSEVHYPGLPSSPYKDLADKYLDRGYGGMLSFAVQGGLEGARKVIDSLEMVQLVPSLAGVSTTISHPAKTSHRGIPQAEREASGVGEGLIRVSLGIEDYADIEQDFAEALRQV